MKNSMKGATKNRTIGIVGLGKMGANVARRLREHGWSVLGYAQSAATRTLIEKEGIATASSLRELVTMLPAPRTVWVMVPAKGPTEEVLFGKEGLSSLLLAGDTVIDAGNSFYKDSVVHAKKFAKHGINFLDVGFSGGPGGARDGGCLMIGGDEKLAKRFEPLFRDAARLNAYQFFKGAGAGHFVKMVHNGIEYGMMQSIAEGFAVLKKSKYHLDLERVAAIYNNGSVIESRLVGWMHGALQTYGEDLKNVSGTVAHTGEGAWTVTTAQILTVPVPIIAASLQFRIASEKKPSYTGKLLSALRNQFGGHSVKR